MDDKITISLTGSRPGKPVATGDDATAFHMARGEADPGWTPLAGQAVGGPGQRYLLGRELGRGTGQSKKQAEINAAALALQEKRWETS